MKNKGAVLVLIVIMLMIMSTFLLYAYSQVTYISSKDFLFSNYYERAIASALSCREVAMARLIKNFQYRTLDTDFQLSDIQNPPKCRFSVLENGIYIDIYATGTANMISASIKSTVSISYTNPKIISTLIFF